MHTTKASVSGIKAQVNDIELCFETFGDPRDPAVLLIAGFGEQMVAWDSRFCNHLAVNGFWVIRFDSRDMGHSTSWQDDAPSRAALAAAHLLGTGVRVSYTLSDLARDCVGLLD